MKNFAYVYPKDVASLAPLLSVTEGQTMIYAGGTDALARLKEGIDQPEKLINIKAVSALDFVRLADDGLHVGATTRLTDVLKSESVQNYPGLMEAIESVGTLQLRNMGTVGGNLCQRPRCWYFRSRHFPCLRKRGDTCFAVYGENKYHAILGGNPCFIVHPSDLAPMLVALAARVKIAGPKKSRWLPIEELFVLPAQDPYHETVLSPQEVITEVVIPPASGKSHYVKFRERQSIDFATVSIAISAQPAGRRLSQLRLVLGGVAPAPWRARNAEAVLENREITDALIHEAGEAEMANAEPLEQNAYKVILAKNALKRAVRELLEN